MTAPVRVLLPIALCLMLVIPPATAASTAASSASDSIGVSVGSLSGSVQQSSNSSSPNRRVAEGDYRVIDVALDAADAEHIRLTLAPAAGDGEVAKPDPLLLRLPREVWVRAEIGLGGIVGVAERPYGLEFAHGQPRKAFFLALQDDWYRELKSTPVSL